MGYKKFRRLDAGQIAKKRKRIYSCRGCGQWHPETKPTQCGCGRMDFDHFDSTAEAKRYFELRMLENRGLISDLEKQKRFQLLVKDNKRIGYYVADFHYYDKGAKKQVTEDVKGNAITELAIWKLKHFKAQYGYEVTLIKR